MQSVDKHMSLTDVSSAVSDLGLRLHNGIKRFLVSVLFATVQPNNENDASFQKYS